MSGRCFLRPVMTARALKAAIEQDGRPDIIFSGKESIDSEGFQTMHRLAAAMNMPAASGVEAFSLVQGKVLVECDLEAGAREVIEMSLPCVIGCGKGLNKPSYPTLPAIIKARKKEVKVLCGLGGAPLDPKTMEWYYQNRIPAKGGMKAAPVPGALSLCVAVTKLYGTMSFEQVVAPSLELLDAGEDISRQYEVYSDNQGETWSKPREIPVENKHGIPHYGSSEGRQLSTGEYRGRLIIPGGIKVEEMGRVIERHVGIWLSDDHGENWQIGGVAQPGTNESVIVQTVDGALYFNCRNFAGEKRRAYAWSYDDGESFPKYGWDDTLPEPICQASMIRFTEADSHDKNRVLFSNPASQKRERMTVRLSYDECQTWNAGKVLNAGPSAYSDLCIASDMSICCLYERGEANGSRNITFARFDLEWLTDGADKLA